MFNIEDDKKKRLQALIGKPDAAVANAQTALNTVRNSSSNILGNAARALSKPPANTANFSAQPQQSVAPQAPKPITIGSLSQDSQNGNTSQKLFATLANTGGTPITTPAQAKAEQSAPKLDIAKTTGDVASTVLEGLGKMNKPASTVFSQPTSTPVSKPQQQTPQPVQAQNPLLKQLQDKMQSRPNISNDSVQYKNANMVNSANVPGFNGVLSPATQQKMNVQTANKIYNSGDVNNAFSRAYQDSLSNANKSFLGAGSDEDRINALRNAPSSVANALAEQYMRAGQNQNLTSLVNLAGVKSADDTREDTARKYLSERFGQSSFGQARSNDNGKTYGDLLNDYNNASQFERDSYVERAKDQLRSAISSGDNNQAAKIGALLDIMSGYGRRDTTASGNALSVIGGVGKGIGNSATSVYKTANGLMSQAGNTLFKPFGGQHVSDINDEANDQSNKNFQYAEAARKGVISSNNANSLMASDASGQSYARGNPGHIDENGIFQPGDATSYLITRGINDFANLAPVALASTGGALGLIGKVASGSVSRTLGNTALKQTFGNAADLAGKVAGVAQVADSVRTGTFDPMTALAMIGGDYLGGKISKKIVQGKSGSLAAGAVDDAVDTVANSTDDIARNAATRDAAMSLSDKVDDIDRQAGELAMPAPQKSGLLQTVSEKLATPVNAIKNAVLRNADQADDAVRALPGSQIAGNIDDVAKNAVNDAVSATSNVAKIPQVDTTPRVDPTQVLRNNADDAAQANLAVVRNAAQNTTDVAKQASDNLTPTTVQKIETPRDIQQKIQELSSVQGSAPSTTTPSNATGDLITNSDVPVGKMVEEAPSATKRLLESFSDDPQFQKFMEGEFKNSPRERASWSSSLKSAENKVSGMSDDMVIGHGLNVDAGAKNLTNTEMANQVMMLDRLSALPPTPEIREARYNLAMSIRGAHSQRGVDLNFLKAIDRSTPADIRASKFLGRVNKALPSEITPEQFDRVVSSIQKADRVADVYDGIRELTNKDKLAGRLKIGSPAFSADDVSNLKQAVSEHAKSLADDIDSGVITKKADIKLAEKTIADYGKFLSDFDASGNTLKDNIKALSRLDQDNYSYVQTAKYDTKKVLSDVMKEHSKGGIIPSMKEISNKIGNYQRSAMLSSLTGRGKDIINTTFESGIQRMENAYSRGLGSVYNKISQKIKQDPSSMVEGLAKSKNVGRSWTGREAREALDVARGRYTSGLGADMSDLSKGFTDKRTGLAMRGKASRGVHLATNVGPISSANLKGTDIATYVNKLGKQAGLSGDSLKTFRQIVETLPDSEVLKKGERMFNKANLVYDNPFSKKLYKVGESIENIPLIGGPLRNTIIPFAQTTGAKAHLALTDRNPLYNAVQIGKNIKSGNAQGVIDNVGKLATNTTLGAGAGALAAKGMLTDTNPDGDAYSSPYLSIFKNSPLARSFSSDMLGSAGLIGGAAHGTEQALSGKNPLTETAKFVGNGLNSMSGSFVDNNAMKSATGLMEYAGKASNGKATKQDQNSLLYNLANLTGGAMRQFSPAIGADAISVDNTINNRNAPKTYVADKDKNIDFLQTALNIGKSGTPILEAQIERNPDKKGNTVIDRMTASRPGDVKTPETEKSAGKQAANVVKDVSGIGDWYAVKDDQTKQGQSKGTQSIKRNDSQTPAYSSIIGKSVKGDAQGLNHLAMTSGELKSDKDDNNYDSIISFYQAATKNDREIKASPKTAKKNRTELQNAVYAKEHNLDMNEIAETYKNTGVKEWRAMASEDPDQYKLLADYDKYMASYGLSGGKYEGKSPKYSAGKSGSGSGSSSGGGRSSGKDKVGTDIATIKSNVSPDKQSYIGLTGKAPALNLTIPQNTSASANIGKKEITVKKGIKA